MFICCVCSEHVFISALMMRESPSDTAACSPLSDCLYSLLAACNISDICTEPYPAAAWRLKTKAGEAQVLYAQTQIHFNPRKQNNWSMSVSLLRSVIARNKSAVSLKVSAPLLLSLWFFLYLFICGVSHQVMWPCPASHCVRERVFPTLWDSLRSIWSWVHELQMKRARLCTWLFVCAHACVCWRACLGICEWKGETPALSGSWVCLQVCVCHLCCWHMDRSLSHCLCPDTSEATESPNNRLLVYLTGALQMFSVVTFHQ